MRNEMVRLKTNDLTDITLDYAVAICEGYTEFHRISSHSENESQFAMMPPRREYGSIEMWELDYSKDWCHSGQIIEREKIGVYPSQSMSGEWASRPDYKKYPNQDHVYGKTPLIAAMRCYVISKLGDEVEVPVELLKSGS